MKKDYSGKRVEKVRKLLSAKGLDALLITGSADVSYLSGFGGQDSWLVLGKKPASPNRGEDVCLITDSRYSIEAKEQCRNCKIYERKGAMAQAVGEVLKKIRGVKILGVEDNIKLSFFNVLRKKLHHRLKPVRNLVLTVRQIKDETEIAAIKKAATVAQEALGKILPKIKAGISELETAAMLDFEMKQRGAEPAFETIIAFGDNSARPHHRPTTRKLKKIDTVLIDFGAKLDGYCSDSTRCFAVGKVNEFYRKVYRAVLDAQTEAINMLKAGVKAKDADAAAKEIITKAKLPAYGHGLGHGLGMEVHERPIVSFLSKDILQKGNVVTIEPAVYLAGKFGIRIEDDVLITERGCEILSSLLKNDDVPILRI